MSRGKPSAAGRRWAEPKEPRAKRHMPKPPDSAPAPVLPRLGRSHANDDGTPKAPLTAKAATEMARRLNMVAYLCSEKPEHYHIGKAVRDGR